MRKFTLIILLLLAQLTYAQTYGVGSADSSFTISPITDELMSRMRKGGSWKSDTPASLRSELRYLKLLYCNAEGKTCEGEMVVNRLIADKVVSIFRKLYEAKYKIERMQLVDDYGADDTRSMTANNTSCFNFRYMTGSKTRISLHGRGLAIDLNPLYNPYVKGNFVDPPSGKPYAHNRTRAKVPYLIDKQDLAYRLFTQNGFRWGGSFTRSKDYQHFEYAEP